VSQTFRINDEIKAANVLLIDETGQSFGTVDRDQALYLAFQKGLDLLEVNPHSSPPVAKIMDFGKFLYQQKKKSHHQKSHARVSEVKQIRLSPTIERHDLETKANHGQKFLSTGHKVKVSIILRGRKRIMSQPAIEIINQFCQLIKGRFESPPRLIGNLVIAIIGRE